VQLLAASVNARRGIDAQVAEAESGLVRAQAELVAAEEDVRQRETERAAVGSRLDQARARRHEIGEEVRWLESVVASPLAGGRTTPLAYPPAKGRSPKDEAARARRDLAEALELNRELALQTENDRQRLERLGESLAASVEHAAAKTREVEQRRNLLENIRQKLSPAGAESPRATLARTLTAVDGKGPDPSPFALLDIPAERLVLYQRAAESCTGLSWTVLAAVGSIESAHGRSSAPGVATGENSAGAKGPMQFLGPTWTAYGVDGDGDGKADVYNATDAIRGAARYLCASGGGELARLADAIWAYNHADW
jgi:hypothetical protein